MEHLAIVKNGWLGKILSGEKTIESRWYKHKKAPFMAINKKDTIYFKETGKQVGVKSGISDVMFFDNLDKNKIEEIIRKYGKQICISNNDASELMYKKYCTLIFLKGVEVIKPFSIDKKGYGNMCAWISVDNIDKLKATGRI
nr:hypothetical protein [uncultured archaeon]